MIKAFLKIIGSTKLFFWLVVYLMVLLTVGTLVQKGIGLYQAQEIYFASWVIWVGGFVPVPGAMAVMAVMSAGLAVRTFSDDWVWPKAGIILTHFAALVLLVGGFVTAMSTQEGALVLAEGERKGYVADYFALELMVGDIRFEGSDLKAGAVLSEGLPFPVEVEAFHMNAEPVLVEGALGVQPAPRLAIEEENLSALRLRALGVQPAPRLAIEEENLSAVQLRATGQDLVVFEDLPMPVRVEHEGDVYDIKLRHLRRDLPFAIELVDFERSTYPGTNNPRDYYSDVIVYDGDIQWRSRIGMNEPLRYKGYTFYQSSFLQSETQEMTVLAVVKNAGRLFPYIASLLLALGLIVQCAQRWPRLMRRAAMVVFVTAVLAAQPAAAQDAADFSQTPVLYEGRAQPIEAAAREALHDFSGRDRLELLSASQWMAAMMFMPEKAARIPVFKIRDPSVARAIGLTVEPDQNLYSFADARAAMMSQMEVFGDLWQEDPQSLTEAQRGVLDVQRKLIKYDALMALEPLAEGSYHARRVQAEWFYERLSLHRAALLFYVAGGLALLFSVFGGRAARWARRLSWAVLLCGGAMHGLAIGMRMYILDRPPVSTLYESVIFVALVVLVMALLYEVRRRDGLGLLIGAAGGALLQLVAQSYSGGGATMGVLVPVLNTNFWLATHVIIITIGYGMCLVTALLAHIGLVRGGLHKPVLAFGLLALLFTIVGTILGGIWADQSWGRFWGWDPKENGAMLICLWLIAAYHGLLGGVVSKRVFTVLIAMLNIVVALAWFGVNLLSVGLHSYGFAEGVGMALLIFVSAELFIIASLYIYSRTLEEKTA